jgi:hypothetical protein
VHITGLIGRMWTDPVVHFLTTGQEQSKSCIKVREQQLTVSMQAACDCDCQNGVMKCDRCGVFWTTNAMETDDNLERKRRDSSNILC